MPPRYQGQLVRTPWPWRPLAYLAVAMLLLLAGAWWPQAGPSLRTLWLTVSAPLTPNFAWPVQQLGYLQQGWQNFYDALDENRVLQAELTRLRTDQLQAASLLSENKELRELLGLVPLTQAQGVVVPVWWGTLNPARQTLLLGAGAQAGLAVGQPVLAGQGVIGRLWRVGDHQAEALLLTDPQTIMPAQLSPSGMLGVVQGGAPVRFIPAVPGTAIPADELVTTSATAALFPAGLPIGYTQRQATGVTVRLLGQPLPPRYVLIDQRVRWAGPL